MKSLVSERYCFDRFLDCIFITAAACLALLAFVTVKPFVQDFTVPADGVSEKEKNPPDFKTGEVIVRSFEFNEDYSLWQIRCNANAHRVRILRKIAEAEKAKVAAAEAKQREELISKNKKFLVVANKKNSLGKAVPKNLVDVDDVQMVKQAAEAYTKLQAALQKQGVRIYATSAYRSYEWQEALYNDYLTRHTKAEVDSFSSRPGYSDHQTGLAVDINISEGVKQKSCTGFNLYTNTDGPSCWNDAGIIKIHSALAEYGFIVRYPIGKQEITGYQPEYWHLRYVGVDAAKYITERKITLEEFLGVAGGKYDN